MSSIILEVIDQNILPADSVLKLQRASQEYKTLEKQLDDTYELCKRQQREITRLKEAAEDVENAEKVRKEYLASYLQIK
jgi:hypothetical protein